MPHVRPRSPEVEDALALLRAGTAANPSDAARQTGAPRTTVRDNWNDEQERGTVASAVRREQTPSMDLESDEIPVIFRDYSHLEKLHVFPLGDVHIGARAFQADKWQEWCTYVTNTPNAAMLGTGDFLNCAIRDSVSDVHAERMTIREGMRLLREYLRPIVAAGKLDLLLPGNHEDRVTKATGLCPVESVAEWLSEAEGIEVPYAPTNAMIVYRVGGIDYEVAARHGTGSSGRAGAQATSMEREALTITSDVYVRGHTHRQQVLRGAVFQRVGKRVQRRRQVFVTSGSFLKYEEYAAKAGLPPADIGCPRIRLDGTRKDPHASI